jgi:solute carrier family 5 (sodium-coupled monocarboxylate transporter), member 8/12
MFSGMFLIIGRGLYDFGGITQLVRINNAGGRLELFDFNPDPFIRQSFWPLAVGSMFYMTTSVCFDQSMLLRFTASKTKRTARTAVLLNIPGMFTILTLCSVTGLVIYAYFKDCDPISNKMVSNPNQILPYYVDLRLSMYWGVSGIFLGSIFSGALSSVSSCLNGLAIIIWQDYLKRFKHFQQNNHSLDLISTKVLVVICGSLSTLLAYAMMFIGDNLWQISTTLNGSLTAPILVMFLLGCFTSICDKYGAIIGSTLGAITTVTLSIGRYALKPRYVNTILPVSNDLCINNTRFYENSFEWNANLPNFTFQKPGRVQGLEGFELVFGISYQWLMPAGVFVGCTAGLITSLINKYIIFRNNKIKVKKSLIIFDLTPFL